MLETQVSPTNYLAPPRRRSDSYNDANRMPPVVDLGPPIVASNQTTIILSPEERRAQRQEAEEDRNATATTARADYDMAMPQDADHPFAGEKETNYTMAMAEDMTDEALANGKEADYEMAQPDDSDSSDPASATTAEESEEKRPR